MATITKEKEIDTDALLGVPEIRQAYDAYVDIQREYQDALRQAIRGTPGDELPDVTEIAAHYGSRLENQRMVVVRLVEKHA